MSTDESLSYLAIGIDFGTTHSAASWATSHHAECIHQVTAWPSSDERLRNESQVPSQVDIETGSWGFLVPKNAVAIRWLKLLLLEPSDLSDEMRESAYLNKMRQLLEVHEHATGCGIAKLVADLFKEIWEHTIHDIECHIVVDRQRLEVAVTVPASWPKYAREKLLAAAETGIRGHRLYSQTTISLLDEADAAATYSLHDSGIPPEIELNDSFLVCDCGGGMVDITGYVKSSSSSSAKAQRITQTRSKLCGGFLVDTNFENWIRRKSSSAKTADGTVQDHVKHEWKYTIKRSFSGRDARQLASNHSRNDLKIPQHSVTQFFAKTYSGIRQLITELLEVVEKQQGKTPKKVFLVGGLGASPYLYLRLQAQFQVILQPSLPWSAVAMGAVIMVLDRRTSTVFKDSMRTENLDNQCVHELSNSQVSDKSIEYSRMERSTEDLQASTLRITSPAVVEPAQDNSIGTHHRKPPEQFLLSDSRQAPSPKPKSSDNLVNTRKAAVTCSHTPEEAGEDNKNQENRHSTSTDGTNNYHDSLDSPSSMTSANPVNDQRKYQEYLSNQIQLLQEENVELRKEIEDMAWRGWREREMQQGAWRNPRQYEDLVQENIQLKQKVDLLEQEAFERSSTLQFIREEGARLASQLAVQVRENEMLTGLLGEPPLGKGEVIGEEGQEGQANGETLEENNHCETSPERQVHKGSRISVDHHKSASTNDDLGIQHILLGGSKAGLIKTASTTTGHPEDEAVCRKWGELCFVVREASRDIAEKGIKFLAANERRDEAKITDTRQRATDGSGNRGDAADTNIPLQAFKPRNLSTWHQGISKYNNTSSLQVFGNTLQLLLQYVSVKTVSEETVPEHRIAWMTEATIWSTLMTLRILPVNSGGSVPFCNEFSAETLAKSLAFHLQQIIGFKVADDFSYKFQQIASSAINLGRDVDRLSSGLWYFDYPLLSVGQRTAPATPTQATVPSSSRQFRGVAFDSATMMERTRLILSDIGPYTVVGLVIRPGLVKMSNRTNTQVLDVKTKCHVITLHPRARSGHYLAR